MSLTLQGNTLTKVLPGGYEHTSSYKPSELSGDHPGLVHVSKDEIFFIRKPEKRTITFRPFNHCSDHEREFTLQLPWMLYGAFIYSGAISQVHIGGFTSLTDTQVYGLPLPNLYDGYRFCMPEARSFVTDMKVSHIMNTVLDIVWSSYYNYDLSERLYGEGSLENYVPFGDFQHLREQLNHMDILKFWEENITTENFGDVLMDYVGDAHMNFNRGGSVRSLSMFMSRVAETA